MDKKCILFFSRLELTDLYGSLHKFLKSDCIVYHIAYSDFEENILKKKYGIGNVLNFKKEMDKVLDNKSLSFSSDTLKELDQSLLNATSGEFNINNALSADRTFKYQSYEDSIKTTIAYYYTWKKIYSIISIKVDFFIHEPVSLMMNFMAFVLCRLQGGVYTTHIMVQGADEMNFLMIDNLGEASELRESYAKIQKECIKDCDLSAEKVFLNNFRNSYNVFFSVIAQKNLKKFLLKNLMRSQLAKLLKRITFRDYVDNIEHFIYKDDAIRRRLRNLKNYRQIKFDDFDKSNKYYFYPIHIEPEAVVLYWAKNRYTNQVKLIENIASQLPCGTFLYVKDHPHYEGYRDVEDYKRIKQIPNVKLLPSSYSGKEIIKHSKGVITINGTGGFEALLLNKHVFVFGRAFYDCSNRVNKINSIDELREAVYGLENVVYEDDYDLLVFLKSYLDTQKKGFTDFYGGVAAKLDLNFEQNAYQVASGLKKYFNR